MISPLVISLCSCDKKQEEPIKARITYDLLDGEKSCEYFDYSFNLDDYANISDSPNNDILKMSMLFDANISDNSRVEFDHTKYPAENNLDQESFYNHLGLEGFEKVTIVSPTEYDLNDITFLNFGHKVVDLNGTKYDICFITSKDSGLGKSWISNFDVGHDDDSYYIQTGEHPEWTNKENHKGFDVAANRCLEVIDDYKTRVLDQNSQQIFYIFGHSRGGAIANVLAAKLVDLGYQTVSYALASPAVTTSNNAHDEKYNHLYSYTCYEDPVTKALSFDLNFKRYGKTISFSIKDYLKEFKQYNGFGFPTGDASPIISLLKNLSDGRGDIYLCSIKYMVAKVETMDEALEYLTPFTGAYEYLKNFVLISLTLINNTSYYVVEVCPGFFTSLFGLLISRAGLNLSTITEELSPLKTYNYLNCLISVSGVKLNDLLSLNPDYLICTHFYPSYLTYINSL